MDIRSSIGGLAVGAVLAFIAFFGFVHPIPPQPSTDTVALATQVAIQAPATFVFDATKFVCHDATKVSTPILAPGATVPSQTAFGEDSQSLIYVATPGQMYATWYHKVLNPTTNVREQVHETVDLPPAAIDCFFGRAGK